MRTIASLKGPDFLRAVNKTRHAVSAFLEDTKVLDIRKIMPTVPEGATEAEKQKLYEDQSRKNISAMLDRLLDEKPEETYDLLLTLIIPDEGEELDGFDLIDAGLELIGSQKVLDFFMKLARSAEQTMAD